MQEVLEGTTLIPQDSISDFRSRWDRIQAQFVDDPKTAVKEADELVAQAIQRLEESFASNRSSLEQQWDRGEAASTEDLRQSLMRYRTFFQRLLSI